MSEAIAEMVLPGTYIEVRAEGLIGAGAIATGNLGVIGTAAKGPVNQVRALSSYSEALDMFGAAGPASKKADNDPDPLTLTRTLELAYGGGARNVFAVRIANAEPTAASKIWEQSGKKVLTLRATEAGTWGNSTSGSIDQEGTKPFKLTVSNGRTKETFSGSNAGEIVAAVNGSGGTPASRLVKAESADASGSIPVGTFVLAQGNDNSTNITSALLAPGLALLEREPVNILVVAGLSAAVASGPVSAHLERTETDWGERIAVLGVASTKAEEVVAEAAGSKKDGRIVLVAPGVVASDSSGLPITLGASYLAAAVAGKLSTLAPHVSLTNKTLPIDELDVQYSPAVTQTLLQNRTLVVRKKFGFQVVKGITSDDGAFRQISVRRIVDFAKAGVRSGADAYIGKLNNSRVRAALKATLDGFLSQMVLDEMLVGYELQVGATRAQEIQGIAAVSMTLKPTFSIDFIRVTMTLQ